MINTKSDYLLLEQDTITRVLNNDRSDTNRNGLVFCSNGFPVLVGIKTRSGSPKIFFCETIRKSMLKITKSNATSTVCMIMYDYTRIQTYWIMLS